MDQKTLQTPPRIPTVETENKINIPDQNTPPPPTCNPGKNVTPDRLKVPKAFKFPERYTSPTDQIMSPVTRGILARCRKGSKLLPPSSKIQALHLQESSGLFQSEKC
ncbi:hypothetical protein ABFS83_08G030800 [Erythranthe nasuta]